MLNVLIMPGLPLNFDLRKSPSQPKFAVKFLKNCYLHSSTETFVVKWINQSDTKWPATSELGTMCNTSCRFLNKPVYLLMFPSTFGIFRLSVRSMKCNEVYFFVVLQCVLQPIVVC